MSISDTLPFIGSSAFNKDTSTFVPFATQSDAMLASLQLFHDIPRRIIDLILPVITHPVFDSRQVTLRSSLDVIRSVEEARLQERMKVVHDRSMSSNGDRRGMDQAGIPQFVLEDILDILVSRRDARIKELLRKRLKKSDMENWGITQIDLEENVTLSNMSLVHRSWTIPAQKSLGQAIFIRTAMLQPHLDHRPFLCRRNSVYGPWTSTLAIQLLHPTKRASQRGRGFIAEVDLGPSWEHLIARTLVDEDEIAEYEANQQQLTDLIELLLTFTNLKHIHIESYFPLYTTLFTPTIMEIVRQNMHLQELRLHAFEYENIELASSFVTASPKNSFILDDLVEHARLTDKIQSLSARGAIFSDAVWKGCMWEVTFLQLRNLEIEYSSDADKTLGIFLSILSTHSHSHIDSLFINSRNAIPSNAHRQFNPEQVAIALKNVRHLEIDVFNAESQSYLIPFCHNLQHLTFRPKWSVSLALIDENCVLALQHVRTLDMKVAQGNVCTHWGHHILPNTFASSTVQSTEHLRAKYRALVPVPSKFSRI